MVVHLLERWQYEMLDAQYNNTPSVAEGTGEGGQHWILLNLLNRFGFNPNSRDEAMQMAQEVLEQEWRDTEDA